MGSAGKVPASFVFEIHFRGNPSLLKHEMRKTFLALSLLESLLHRSQTLRLSYFRVQWV